ncbi:MAG: S24/S26 family peptidase [Sandaracinaceae bacterium]
MLPAVLPGTLVLFEPVRFCAVRRGDLVLLLRGPRLLAHRVVAKDPRGLTTAGDHAEGVDGAARPGEVLGRAVSLTLGPVSLAGPRPLTRVANRWIGRLSRPLAARLPPLRAWGAAAARPRWVRRLRALQGEIEVGPAADAGLFREACRRRGRWVSADAAARALRERPRPILAVARRRPVGWVLPTVDPETPSTVDLDLWLEPLWRGLGVGGRLLEAAAAEARSAGALTVRLTTPWPAGRWMLRRGFRPAGVAPRPAHRTRARPLAPGP